MKVELCAFSGKKIYPGHGRLYVRTDNRSFRFVDSKCLSLFLQRKKPSKIHWTIVFRRMHKKGITEEVAKKRTRKTVKVQRSIVGVSLEKITALRNEKPEIRAAAREKAIKDAKAKKEKSKAEKKASSGNNSNKISKQQAKGARPAVAAKSR
ncbi:60S ribosomal protein L24 [Entomophthora muscae]|uniref:60S ribosomal protein L24 n=1 Tax=Entomophthora muscae TaxID=34485 RepID=A0ACC2U690_9FUNG|nr:60S ribosomal protein L24 [Entomophthora muscae]